jgi:hypothetical protein
MSEILTSCPLRLTDFPPHGLLATNSEHVNSDLLATISFGNTDWIGSWSLSAKLPTDK